MPSKLTDPPIDTDLYHRSILPAEPVALFSADGDNVRMSAIEDPEYPERPFIRMFLSGFDNGVWKDASLNWIEETQENAVEVIATSSTGKTVALEHTLIELFTGEKYDSTIGRSRQADLRGLMRTGSDSGVAVLRGQLPDYRLCAK
jgi:hypothetical protein